MLLKTLILASTLFAVVTLMAATPLSTATLLSTAAPGQTREASDPAAATQSLPRSVDRRAITALGRIEPAGRVVEVGAFSEARIEELLVAEGDWVEAGQDLFRLDSHAERNADRDLSEARLAAARERLDSEIKLAEQAIRDAEIELRRITTLDPVVIEAQKARVDVMATRFANEQRSLTRKKNLGDSVSRESLEDQQSLVEETEKNLAAARADLRASEVGHDLDLLQAQADVDRSKLLLQRARALHTTATAEKELARSEILLADSIIRAPRSGQILRIARTAGERIGPTPVLQLGNTREMHVVAEVYETEVTFVREGQRATIESSAFEGKVEGEVIDIGFLVFKNDILDVDPLADIDTRVVEVRIRLEKNDVVSRLTNLEVDVEILLQSNLSSGK